MAEIESSDGRIGGDAAMAARDEPIDRIGAGLHEIEVERGVGLAAGRLRPSVAKGKPTSAR